MWPNSTRGAWQPGDMVSSSASRGCPIFPTSINVKDGLVAFGRFMFGIVLANPEGDTPRGSVFVLDSMSGRPGWVYRGAIDAVWLVV